MERPYYLNLAASGLRMPIGTHLVLHQHENPEAILLNGRQLGAVVEEAAIQFKAPMAVPVMDLKLEKEALLSARGIPAADIESYHFAEAPETGWKIATTPRMSATCEAIRHIAQNTSLLPVGIGIGPFSLMTKLISDPITPVFLAGPGSTADEDSEVRLVESTLALGLSAILTYLQAQIAAGAKAIILCEPAANKVYFSPNQLAESYEIFDRYVMEPNRKIKALLDQNGVDLIFHDCGELEDEMIRRFATLDPAMMSLGSSRKLWEDAALVPDTTVLFGNLPTKKFYSDALVTVDDVKRLSDELTCRMQATGHPFILGSECDVLSVPGAQETIKAKVEAFLA
ncbi:MAG: uroporphyrinogen decarboxylase family protein [Chthoniobacteraceae bacterium]|nr:uroporphyrinogen decarboxylase family protein [Chthoniobacteraceae bacterium]